MNPVGSMFHYYLGLTFTDIRRSPWLVMIMVSTLAVGLATSMATLALRHALTGDPIPGKSTRLFTLQGPSTSELQYGLFSYVDATSLSQLSTAHVSTVISGEAVIRTVSAADETRQFRGGLSIRYTSGNFFRVFNASLKAGRTWDQHEQLASSPVVVLASGLADVLFPKGKALGKQVSIGNVSYTVIGVLAAWHPQPRYYDMDSPSGAFGGGGDAIYLPYTTVSYAPPHAIISMVCRGSSSTPSIPAPNKMAASSCRWLSMWYLAHSRKDVKRLTQAVHALLPQVLSTTQCEKLQLLDVRQILARASLVPASLQTYVLLGIAFLALCVINASGMQLSRAVRHTPSIGIRRALGARRIDIIWQHLVNALLIGGIGGALGIAATYGVLAMIRHIPERYVAYSHMAQVDDKMLAVMVVVALLSSVLAGVVPAIVASRIDPALAIKGTE